MPSPMPIAFSSPERFRDCSGICFIFELLSVLPSTLIGIGAPLVRSHAGTWKRGDSGFSPGTKKHSAVPLGLRVSGCRVPGNELPGYFRVSPWDRFGVEIRPLKDLCTIEKSPGCESSRFVQPVVALAHPHGKAGRTPACKKHCAGKNRPQIIGQWKQQHSQKFRFQVTKHLLLRGHHGVPRFPAIQAYLLLWFALNQSGLRRRSILSLPRKYRTS